MKKTSVYNGEVVGFTAGRFLGDTLDIVSVYFDTQEDAETWCEDMHEMSSNNSIYVPIKLTSLSNKHTKEHSYD